VGGILTDNLSWQWVFDINAVPGTLAAIIVIALLRNPAPPRKLPFDGVGIALLAAGLGSLQYVLDEGERNDWFGDERIVGFAVAGVLGIAAFIAWELRARAPIVDLRMFRYPNLRSGTVTAVLLGMVIFGPTVMLPQYVQTILGFSATQSGLLVLLRALPVLACTPLVARLATKVDVRILLGTGFLLSAASFVMLGSGMTAVSDFGTFALALVVSGVGQSMLLVPLLVGIISTVAPQDSPKASSFVSLSVQLGGSIASTVLVTVFDRRTFFHSDIYRGALTLHSPQVAHLLTLPHALQRLSALVQQQAASAGFADAIFALVPVAVAAVLVCLLLRVPRRRAAPVAMVAVE
jgi:DHA2 family multidrug resistance protein